MAKQLNVNVAVTADTGQAKAQLQQLQNSLQQLSASSANLKIGIDPNQIQQASYAATELAAHLKQATTSTGTLDFSKLNTSIASSGKTLIEYGNQLQKLGPQGQQAFQQLAQAVSQSEIPVKRVSALFGEFGTVLKNTIRWQLSSSMIHGFMGGIQQAYRYAQNLNESLNRIQIVTQNSDTQMAKFAETANKAAKSLSTTTTTYTDAALIYYQQGLNDKQVKERTDVTIKMANAAGVSAKTVSDQMTAVWNNFDDGSKSLEYYADVMTALGAATASSTDEISKGLSKFATVADTVGLSYENAAAALATITATTRNSADSVGTGLRTLFSRLQSVKLGDTLEDGVDLTKYTKALETVGVRALDATGELRSMDNILEDLGGRWQNLTNTQKVALAQTVGGVRQYTNLIALMDNFDFYKRNQDVALSSEGTVQKQADIYAKSWGAAQKRVRASAESIYSDIISDKFFIGLTDGFAKVLDSIDSIIDRIGGLKGVLLNLGGIFTNLFSNQIAGKLYDFSVTVGSLFVNQQNQRNNFIDQAVSKMGFGQDQYGKQEQEFVKEQLKMQNDFAKNSQYMSQVQQMTARMSLDNYGKAIQDYRQAGDKANAALTSERRVRGTFVNDYLKTVLADKYGETSTTYSDKLIQFNSDFDNFLVSPLKNFEKQLKVFDDFKEVGPESFEAFSNALKEAKVEGAESFLEEFKEDYDPHKLDVFYQNVLKQRQEVFKDFDSMMIGEYDENFDPSSEEYQQMKKDAEARAKAEAEAERAAERAEGQKGNVRKAIDEEGVLKTAQGLTQMASGMMSFIAASNGVENIAKTIDQMVDGTTELGDGFKSLATQLTSTTMQATMGISAMAQGLKALGATTPWMIGITAAFAALSLIVPAVSGFIEATRGETDEEMLERLTEEANQAKSRAQEASQAYDDLLSSRNRHNELLDTLNSLTEGTEEFRDALIEANDIAQELINTYNLQYGSDYYYDKRGIAQINEGVLDQKQQEALTLKEKEAQNSLIAGIAQQSAEVKTQAIENAKAVFGKVNVTEEQASEWWSKNNQGYSTSSQFMGGQSFDSENFADIIPSLLGGYAQAFQDGVVESFEDYWKALAPNGYKDHQVDYTLTKEANKQLGALRNQLTGEMVQSAIADMTGITDIDSYITDKSPEYQAWLQRASSQIYSFFGAEAGKNGRSQNIVDRQVINELVNGEWSTSSFLDKLEAEEKALSQLDSVTLQNMYKEIYGFFPDTNDVKELSKTIAYQNIAKQMTDRYTTASNDFYNKIGYLYQNTTSLSSRQLSELQQQNAKLTGQYKEVADLANEQAVRELLTSADDFIHTTASFWETQGNAIPEIFQNVEALKDFSKDDWDYLTNQAHNISAAFGDKAAGMMMADLMNGYKSNSELAIAIRGQNFTGSSIRDIGSLNKLRKSKTLTETAQAQVEEYYNAALEGIGGNKGLFEELYHSEEFADDLKTLRKELKKTGKIGADSIAAMAEESDFLNEFLDESVFTAQSLADVLQMLEVGDIGIDGLTEELLKALGVSKELDNNLSEVFGHIDNYKKERSVQDIGKFYKGLADDVKEGWTSGMLLDKPLLQAWEEMFGAESVADYRSQIYKLTNDKNRTPEQISDALNSKYKDEVAAMQSIQERGNLSGMFEYYNKQGQFKNMFSYNKETGQVTSVDRDKLIKQGFDSQEAWIDALIQGGVPEFVAKSMAAEYAATNGNIAQLWNTTAAEKGIGQLLGQAEGTRIGYKDGHISGITNDKVGGVLTGAELRTFWNANKDVLKDIYGTQSEFMDAMQEGAKNAHKAFVDLGKDFNFAKASSKELENSLKGQGYSEGIKEFVEAAGYKTDDVNGFSTALQRLGYSAAQSFEVIDGYLADNKMSIKDAFFGDDKNGEVYSRFEDYMRDVKGLSAEVATAANVADFMDWDAATQQAEAAAETMANAIKNAFADLFSNLELEIGGLDGQTITIKVKYDEEGKPDTKGGTTSGTGGGGTSGGIDKTPEQRKAEATAATLKAEYDGMVRTIEGLQEKQALFANTRDEKAQEVTALKNEISATQSRMTKQSQLISQLQDAADEAHERELAANSNIAIAKDTLDKAKIERDKTKAELTSIEEKQVDIDSKLVENKARTDSIDAQLESDREEVASLKERKAKAEEASKEYDETIKEAKSLKTEKEALSVQKEITAGVKDAQAQAAELKAQTYDAAAQAKSEEIEALKAEKAQLDEKLAEPRTIDKNTEEFAKGLGRTKGILESERDKHLSTVEEKIAQAAADRAYNAQLEAQYKGAKLTAEAKWAEAASKQTELEALDARIDRAKSGREKLVDTAKEEGLVGQAAFKALSSLNAFTQEFTSGGTIQDYAKFAANNAGVLDTNAMSMIMGQLGINFADLLNIPGLEQLATTLQGEVENLTSQAQEAQNIVDTFSETEVATREAAAKQAEAEAQAAQDKANATQEQINGLDQTIAEYRKAMAEETQTDERSADEARAAELEEQIAALEAEKTQLEAQKAEEQKNADTLADEALQARLEAEAAKEEAAAQQKLIDEQQGLKDIQDSLALTTQKQIESLNAEIAKNTATKQELTLEKSGLLQDQARNQLQLEAVNAQLKLQEAAVAKADAEYQATLNAYGESSAEAQAAIEALNSAQQLLQQLQEKQDALEKEKDNKQSELDEIQSQIDAISNTITETENAVEAIRDQEEESKEEEAGSEGKGTGKEENTETESITLEKPKGPSEQDVAANDYWKSVEEGFWGGGKDNVYGTSNDRAWWAQEHIKNAAAKGNKGAQAFQQGLFDELGISSWSELTTEGLGQYLEQLSKVDEASEEAAKAKAHELDVDVEATQAAEAAAKAQEDGKKRTEQEKEQQETVEVEVEVEAEAEVKEPPEVPDPEKPVEAEAEVDKPPEVPNPEEPVEVEAEVNEESLPEDQEAKVNYVLGTQDLPQDKTANVNYALGSQVPPKDMTAYVHYKRGSQEGAIGSEEKASGYNNGNGAFAGGKHNNGNYWGLATVGELGPELQIHRGMPYLVGISGRTQTYVEPGDSIFTAAETQKILENNPTLQDIPGFSVGYNQVSWGKSSGGVGAGDGKNKKTKEFDPERYHLITRQLADITRWYDRLDKIKDKAFGRNKIKAIQDEIDVTNDLIKAQQALIDEAKKYRDQDLQRLKDLGISFNLDANGNITNWDELQEQYGRVATEAEDEDTKKAAADRWKAIQQYEETIDKLHEAEEGMADYIMQLSELTLETITVEVDYKLEYDKRGMDYLQHFIDKLEDNIYETAARFQLIGAQVDTFNHKINSSLQGINDIFEKMTDQEGNAIEGLTIAKFLAMTPEERENLKLNSEYVESIDEYLQNMIDDAEGLEKLKTTGIDMIKQGFDELNDSVEKQIDLFDHYNSLLESLQNISDLTGKGSTQEARTLIDALSEAKLNNTLNNLSSLQQQYKAVSEARKTLYDQYINETDETLRKAYKEEYDKYTDTLNELQEQILSVHADGLQQITDQFQNAMNDIIKIYQNSFSEIGDLSFLQGMYDRQREIDEQYAHDYEKYYRLSKLERDINKTIDTLSISSGRRNKALGAILEEVNQAQKEGKAMSEYDLELLRKKYEVEKARAELEEARDAKSTVRLQRNNNGTWGYVYTANEDNVAELEQKLEDSVYELQKFNEEYNQKLVDSFFRMAQDMGDLVSGDIWELLMSPIEEERKQGFAQIEEINAQYGQISAYTMEQMKHAWEGNQWSLDFALEIYKNKMKDDGTAFNDLTDTFTETTISTITGAQSAEEWIQTITTNMQTLLASAQEEIEKYLGKIDQVNQQAGLSAGNITDQIITMTQTISASSDETAESVEDLADILVTEFNKIAENAKLWEKTYISAIQNMVQQTEQLVTTLGNAINILGLGNDLLNAYNIGTSAVLRQDIGYQWSTPSQMAEAIDKEIQINDEVVSAAMKAIRLYESMPETIGGIGLLNAPALMDQLSQMLEQEVTIHAEFPNVTDHYEIEQAFDNLVNKATQYANEKRNG